MFTQYVLCDIVVTTVIHIHLLEDLTVLILLEVSL